MKYIIYHSTASIYFRPEGLEEMMMKFRKNNVKNSITGLLLYSEGTFLQLFEGEDIQVNKLMKKIQKDKNHHSLIILVNTPSEARMFPDWSMGFESMPTQQFLEIKQLIQPVFESLGKINPAVHQQIIGYFRRFMADPV